MKKIYQLIFMMMNVLPLFAQNGGKVELKSAAQIRTSYELSFLFKRDTQVFVVPEGVWDIHIEAWGAEGGTNTAYDGSMANAGRGGYAVGTLAVTPGQKLHVVVGGKGSSNRDASGDDIIDGGFNGGGKTVGRFTGSGGGASDVRVSPYSLSDRVIVAGGGGGATFGSMFDSDTIIHPAVSAGGDGGGLTGEDGQDIFDLHYEAWVYGGKGGTQSAGGAKGIAPIVYSGNPEKGAFGIGGGGLYSTPYHTAGGGGGWYGGGSGAGNAGAGGGSSYVGGVTDAYTAPGIKEENGMVMITMSTNLVFYATAGDCGTTVTYNDPSEFKALYVYHQIDDSGYSNGDFFPVGTTEQIYAGRNSFTFDPDTVKLSVTVLDTISPEAKCKDVTIYLDEEGTASIDGELDIDYGSPDPLEPVGFSSSLVMDAEQDIDDGSFDACGIRSLLVSRKSFVCSSVGPNVVTLKVIDNNGNVSTCTSTVTVADDMPPEAKCKNITISLDEDGMASIAADDIDNGSSDVCGIGSFSLSQNSFNCSSVGTNLVTLKATDNNGNTSTCTSTVTVVDEIQPEARCKDITVYLDEDGIASIAAEDIDNGSSDACGISTFSLNKSSFDVDFLGNNPVVLTVADYHGNSSGCESTVTVLDTISVEEPPVLVSPLPDQTAEIGSILKIPLDSPSEGIFDDENDDELTFAVEEEGTGTLPEWITLVNDTLFLEPSVSDTGCVVLVITATNDAGVAANDTFEVCTEESVVGIDDLGKGKFEVLMYPNPSRGKVNLEMSTKFDDIQLTVTNIIGQMVIQQNYPAMERVVFDMSGKKSGTYFVRIGIGDSYLVRKLVVE